MTSNRARLNVIEVFYFPLPFFFTREKNSKGKLIRAGSIFRKALSYGDTHVRSRKCRLGVLYSVLIGIMKSLNASVANFLMFAAVIYL